HMGVPGGIEAGEPGGDDPDCWDWTWNVIGPELYSPGTLELYTPNRAHFGSNFAAMRIPEDRVSTQTDVMATTQAIAILENRAGTPPEQSNRTKSKPDGPFFLAVGLVRPHVPLIAPQHCFDLYDAAAMPLPEVPEGDLDDIPPPARLMDNAKRYHMDEANQRNALAAYFACVTFMDEQVGRLLDALDRLDLRKDTIVIFLSDHGWNLGQHHCWQKLSLWEDSTRVPLIISAPEMKGSAGKTARGIVETVDLYPTVVDLCGLAAEAPATLQGISLRPLLENPERSDWEHTAYTVTHQKGESIRRGPWRYSIWGQAGEELYNHDSDPGEFTNLAQNPEYTSVLESLRTELDRKRRHSLGKD
ncbi:MAG: sulfatase-like hydrolase/transferase, partial [Verrucomicrobiales bacterium]|nr:sulfatase-like hydrolase/transferase [Verrucomicrobiales bacterium]